MGDFGDKIMAIITAIVTLAIIAVVLSFGANTTNVIGSFFSGLAGLIGVAISPVTGQTSGISGNAFFGQPLQGSIIGLGVSNLGNTGGTLAGTGIALNGLGGALTGGANLISALGGGGGGSLGGSGVVDTGNFDFSGG
jgi:hypothetical protein